MVTPAAFYAKLEENGITFFSGVPDSLLKDICAYITDTLPAERHIIAANEGGAVGLAAGHYLATGKPALVYMQNSGQGNTINPLLSLMDPDVYSIPVLLLIGWRGEPGDKDEPQHVKQGKVTLSLLECLGIPCEVLPEDETAALAAVDRAVAWMREHKAPYAIVIRKKVFAPYSLQKKTKTDYPLDREGALKLCTAALDASDMVVSTTGKTSRELFEYREEQGQGHGNDFLTVGGMGHASQIALGMALAAPDRQVFCFDGDGAVLMHMGALAIGGNVGAANFKHVLFNNGAHDSVGGQPTVGFSVDFGKIATACGYRFVLKAATAAEISAGMATLRREAGPGLLEITVNKGGRDNLGRPTTTPVENKESIMRTLGAEA